MNPANPAETDPVVLLVQEKCNFAAWDSEQARGARREKRAVAELAVWETALRRCKAGIGPAVAATASDAQGRQAHAAQQDGTEGQRPAEEQEGQGAEAEEAVRADEERAESLHYEEEKVATHQETLVGIVRRVHE
ncbi:hypothetical protein JCM10213_005764 [Rhodosporidiobolus nylandii]